MEFGMLGKNGASDKSPAPTLGSEPSGQFRLAQRGCLSGLPEGKRSAARRLETGARAFFHDRGLRMAFDVIVPVAVRVSAILAGDSLTTPAVLFRGSISRSILRVNFSVPAPIQRLGLAPQKSDYASLYY